MSNGGLLMDLDIPGPRALKTSAMFMPSFAFPKTICLPSNHSGSLGSTDEKLGIIRFVDEVLIGKFLPIDELAAGDLMVV